ncbi:inactive histone-lysine N-methyltransferase 2E-like isoform X2 [Liolophura sinensis]|uniref:inactive histone-lysine N-methyltransferase 2E-like isoform X2 n=1 Tax=Liolophura sinensis TaxID=3198878 RepID=UPI00315845FE
MSVVLRIGAVQSESTALKMAAGTDPDSMEASPVPEDLYVYHPPQQTYSSCFGLPYQDHNYGAPPPPTPPQSPPPCVKVNGHIDVVEETVNIVVAKAVSELNQGTGDSGDDSITRCICDYQHDDGYMICCDKCSVWQHIDCMSIDRNNIPDAYCCEQCEPRVVDKQKARELQARKREEMTDSSATDTDPDEAAHHLALLKAQANANKKGKSKKALKKDITKDLKPRKQKKEKEKKKDQKEKKRKLGNTNNTDVSTVNKLQNNKENAKKLAQLKPCKKNRSVDFQLDETRDAWNSSVSPWADGYEPARNNHYSSALQEILSVNKFNGQHADEVKKVGELQVQLCCVADVKKNRKGLKASMQIQENEAIIEYVGRVMLKDQYDTEKIFFKILHPFVLFYTKFDNTSLCIDASNYGNDARFVRRSCTPNAEIRHIVSSGNIRFYIFSTTEIAKGTEITIPFDYQYKDCSYNVECSCSKVNCVVSKKKRKRNSVQNSNADTSPVVFRTSKRCQAQKAREQEVKKEEVPVIPTVAPPDTSFLESLANAAVAVSMAEQSLSELPLSSSDDSPHKVDTVDNNHICSSDNTISSTGPMEGETEEQAAERERKLTREERKMQAIMKAFEKLEKREERRKEALARLEVAKKTKVEKSQSEDLESLPAVEVKQEVVAEQKPQKGKRRKSHPARRRSRVSSGNSECTVGSEDSNMGMPASAPTTPSPNAEANNTRCPNSSDKNFRFVKTKRHLMNEWLSEKTQVCPLPPVTSQPNAPPTLPATLSAPATTCIPKIEPLEVNVEETMFVTCLPSPRNTLEYMRRNSHSSGDKQGQGCSIGSAKKRWLRQAMCESTQSSDSGKESPALCCDDTSPCHTATMHSPGGSPPVDFVTPLKKRRLARESLSADQPPTPSALSPPLSCTGDEPAGSAAFSLEDATKSYPTVPESSACTTQEMPGGVHPAGSEGFVSAEHPSGPHCKEMLEMTVADSSVGQEKSNVNIDTSVTMATSSEVVTDSAYVCSEVSTDTKSAMEAEEVTDSSLSQSFSQETHSVSEQGNLEGEMESHENSDVVSSNVILAAHVDKDRICSSSETDCSAPVCSADTSTETAEISKCAQDYLESHSNPPQPSSTAATSDSSSSVNEDSEVMESQGSRLCDSAGARSCLFSTQSDVSCTSPKSTESVDRTTVTCDVNLVSGSVREQNSGSNLHVESSSTLERLTDSGSEPDQPACDPSVSSTSQTVQALHTACVGSGDTLEANEAFSPGVSSTVSDLQRDHVSSLSGDSLKITGSVGERLPASACDSSMGVNLPVEPPAGVFHSSMTVMSADSTSTAPPPPLPPPPLPPQPPPPPVPAKKKVSLLEYRKRLKEKGSGTSSNGTPSKTVPGAPATPPAPGRNTPTLAPLPFFDPGSPGRPEFRDGLSSPLKKDEDVRWGSRSRDKPLSLTERLRMEFGLDDSDEEESSPELSRDAQSAQNAVVHRPVYANHDPRIQGLAIPQPVPPPGGQPRLGPPVPGQPPGRIPSLMSLQTFPSRPHPSHPNSTHQSPHVFNQSPPPPPPGAAPPPPHPAAAPAPTPYQGGLHTANHVGSVNNTSRIPATHHPAVYTTPTQSQRTVAHPSPGFPQSNKSNYSMGPLRQRAGGQPSYNHTQYSAHAPTRPPLYSAGAAPPPHPSSNNQPYPSKPLPQTAAAAASPQTQPYSSRTSSSFTSHSYNHKKHY